MHVHLCRAQFELSEEPEESEEPELSGLSGEEGGAAGGAEDEDEAEASPPPPPEAPSGRGRDRGAEDAVSMHACVGGQLMLWHLQHLQAHPAAVPVQRHMWGPNTGLGGHLLKQARTYGCTLQWWAMRP